MSNTLLHKVKSLRNKSFRHSSPGFTLVEILIVLTLIATLTVPLIISYQNSRTTQALRTSAEELANQVRSAHVFAREANEQKGWGILRTSETTYSLVSGEKYDWTVVTSRRTEHGVTFQNDFFIWFELATGETDMDYSIVLSTPKGITQTVNIVTTGLVEILN